MIDIDYKFWIAKATTSKDEAIRTSLEAWGNQEHGELDSLS